MNPQRRPGAGRGDAFARAMGRVRGVAALSMAAVAAAYRPDAATRTAFYTLSAVLIAGLLLNNAPASLARRTGPTAARNLVVAQVLGDGVLITVALLGFGAAPTGTANLLLAVPIVEAAVYVRLRGALVVWGAITALLLWRNVGVLTLVDPAHIGELVAIITALLCVSLPVGYSTEYLVHEIESTVEARFVAERRAEMLAVLALAGHDLHTMTIPEIYRAMVEAAFRLGGVAADGHMWDGRRWGPVEVEPLPVHPAAGALGGDLAAPDESWADGITVTPGPWAVVALRLTTGRFRLLVRVVTEDLWSGMIGEALDVLAFQAGIALRNAELHEHMQLLTAQLSHRAEHDPLTGLPNRLRLRRALDEASRAPLAEGLALLYLDLDGFKPVNDRLGHTAGDELLLRVAERLRMTAGPTALTVRLGGDEFAVLLRGREPDAHAELLRRRIGDRMHHPFTIGPHVVSVGASVGFATAEAGEVIDPAALIDRADHAMYDDKAHRKSTARALREAR